MCVVCHGAPGVERGDLGRRTHSEEEIWGIVTFLERVAGMSPEEYAGWEA